MSSFINEMASNHSYYDASVASPQLKTNTTTFGLPHGSTINCPHGVPSTAATSTTSANGSSSVVGVCSHDGQFDNGMPGQS